MKILNACVLALVLTLPATAFAAGKKPAPAKKGPAAAATPAPKDTSPPKPQLSTGPADASAFAGDVDDSPEWFKKTDEAIAELTDLIRTLPDGDVKATRMIQLAELYWQKASRLHLRAVKQFNKIYDAWFTNNGAQKGIPEPKLNDDASDAVMNKAVTIYEFVIKKYPDNQRGDQAHFYLGQSYLQLGKKEQAVATFKKLVDHYPQSEFIPDAYLGLGEFFFENKQLPEAIVNYGKATQYPNAKNWGYAMYKLGWCYMNTHEPEKAVEAFKKVVSFSIQQESQGHTLEYKDQALKDLVVAYADVGRVDEAEQYFKSVGGGEYFRKMLEYLGSTYFEQGRDDDCINIYRRLIALDPMNSHNLTYEGEILKAYIRKSDRPQILAQLDHIVKMVQPESPWVKQNASLANEIQEQRDSLEGSVSKYTREVYEESKKLNTEQSFKGFQQAEQFCTYYLQTFTNAKNAYPIRMMLAETEYKLAGHPGAGNDVKYRIQRYQVAEDAYLKVVTDNPKGEFANLASEDAIFSADKVLELVAPLRKDPHPAKDDFSSHDVPPEEQGVIKACDVYVKFNPKGPKNVPTRYKAARIFYEYNQFDEAVKRFNDVIAVAPGSEQARYGADLILDTYGTIKKDASTANQYARNFLKIPALADQKNPDDGGQPYRHDLENQVQRTQFTIVQTLDQQKKYQEAAEGYIAFAKEFPSSPIVADSYYNASVAYVNAGHVDDAIKVREAFIKQFPDNPHTPEVISFLGDNYRKTIAFDKAADYFEMLASKYPKYKDSPDLLYNAALFRENLGQLAKAIDDYRTYMKVYADRPDTCEVLYTIADVYLKKGKDTAAATKTFDEYVKTCGYKGKGNPDLYLDSKVQIAQIIYDKGNKKDAYTKYAEIVKDYNDMARQKQKIGPTGLGAAAQSAFYQVEPKFEEYKAVKLDNVKTLAPTIKKKISMIKPLVDAYTKVVEYKHGDWAVASLYQVGLLSEEFVNAVKDAPIPPEVKTSDQKDLYELDLQEKFQPVEDAAVDFYTKCIDTSAEYRIYNQFTRKSIEGRARIRSSQFAAKDPEIRISASTDTAAFESSPIIEVK